MRDAYVNCPLFWFNFLNSSKIESITAIKKAIKAVDKFMDIYRGKMERETRFELATPTLARSCSTN